VGRQPELEEQKRALEARTQNLEAQKRALDAQTQELEKQNRDLREQIDQAERERSEKIDQPPHVEHPEPDTTQVEQLSRFYRNHPIFTKASVVLLGTCAELFILFLLYKKFL
jgi:uncharacterized protein (DUF3084 family)